MSAPRTPLELTSEVQRRAADPANSAFIAANAGAGKTSVLTNRVARLLLAGARPDRIVCITFTKAAAAEMADRLFKMLGKWALLPNDALNEALDKLEGGSRKRDADTLARARRLFARALETPGGLKIQTIHSFCERVLKRFPLEAGVAPGFSVIEDSDANALAAAALDEIAIDARNERLYSALRRLASCMEPEKLRDLLVSHAVSRLPLAAAINGAGGWDGLSAEIAQRMGADPSGNVEALQRAAVDCVSPEKLRQVQSVFQQGQKNAQKIASEAIPRFLAASSLNERYETLFSLLLTRECTPRQKFGDAQTKKIDPSAEEYLHEAAARFAAACDRIMATRNFAETDAFLTALAALWPAYERKKAARAALDYDDLIARTRDLFADRGSAAWVHYKLDQGLDHILLDEAQDTSPAQWAVVEGPLEEFFSGEGARATRRTFFAVGDQKQSIYSFQGADASLFQEKREDLGKRIENVSPFVAEPLTLSFRTVRPVLAFVDALFEADGAREGLWEDKLRHGVYREGAAGLVELWPLTPRPEKADGDPWDAPLDSIAPEDPVRKLAEAVAARIRRWLDDKELLESENRPITPGDVMILVQSRAPLFHEMIRALGRANVPVAGADRLKLLEDPAVEDLLAFARVALLDTDDLSLAELLKSPFFNFTDDDLMKLAPGREKNLWRTLRERAGADPRWREAAETISRARAVGLKEGAYAFFVHVLQQGAPSGRAKLYARLGEASRETIDELLRQALDYELKSPRSLQGFLLWFMANAGEIKREMDQASNAVRVMTVHGAKGLEAPIVFLLDAHRLPKTQQMGPVFRLPEPDDARAPVNAAFALSTRSRGECAALQAARQRQKRLQYEEYRRLLYVAATRARDRLYICGVEPGNQKDPDKADVSEKNWHALACDAFKRLDNTETFIHQSWRGQAFRIASGQTAEAAAQTRHSPRQGEAAPEWLRQPCPQERAPVRLAPSALADEEEARAEPAAYSPARGEDAFLRGRTLHRLLQLLPGLAPGARAGAADRLLSRLAPGVDPQERARWREEVLAVLADPAFAPVFAENSRAEVSIAGAPRGVRAGVVISGQIDRLVVTDSEILIVDYKTNRPPPSRIEEVSPSYVAQLAAYRALLEEIHPGRSVRAALLWTYEARLMEIPGPMLDHAFARHLA